MDWEEAKPAPKAAISIGEDLSKWSVAELDARVAALEAEIARTQAEIGSKKAHNAAAVALFKKE